MAYFGPSKRVPIGELIVTDLARSVITDEDALSALTRQGRGDWGEVSREEWECNDCNLRCRGRVRSMYRTTSGVLFLVITDIGRSATMVGLPEDWEQGVRPVGITLIELARRAERHGASKRR